MKINNCCCSLIIGLILTVSVVFAMPPRPGLELPPTDYEEMLRLGINVIKDPIRDVGKKGIYNKPGDVVPLVTGTKQFPVVLIKFADFINQYSVQNFQAMLFSDTWNSGSAKKYYQDVSYGMFTLNGQVFGWYTSDYNKAYYSSFSNAARLAKEAAQKSDAVVNYALYDNDGDGYVDCFTCVHAGYGREETGSSDDIHSHAWSFSGAGIGVYTTNDPDPNRPGQYIKIDQYVMCPERSNYTNYGTMVTIGVFCHEWGHALGLPDLYDTDQGSSGLGNWCLMAGGSWGGNGNSPWSPVHLSAWAKMELGWLNPRAVRKADLYSIPQVETNSKAFWLIGRQRTFKEYFLIENRRKTGFDVNLPGQGLLIYHIDDSVIAQRRGSNKVNAGIPWKYGVALEQADGLDHLYNGNNQGDAGDPFPGSTNNTNFDSSATNPNSKTNYPTAAPLITGSLVKNISSSATVMSCTMRSGVQGVFKSLPDAGNYYWIDSDTIGGPSFNWIDITETGNVLGAGDNALYWFRLPYNFYFYGVNYDTVWVSTNGWISFGINPNTSAQSNTSIPSTAAPNRAVYVFWDDLNIVASDGGNIYYQTLGTFPNRYTVITWNNAQIKNSAYTFNQITFQVILYENGKIIMQYKDCAVGDSVYNWGRNATIGIENATGTIGLQYLYNGAPLGNLVTNERAIQFFRTDFNDVEVVRIEVPDNAFDSTGPITPRVRVRNNGTEIETFNVTLKIGTGYTATRSKTLGGGIEDTVTFPLWTPQRGSYVVKCSVYLSSDEVPANNVLSTSTLVGVNDIQVVAINYPVGTIDSGGAIYPKATVKNHSALAKTFIVVFKVNNGYIHVRSKDLNSSAQDTVNFNQWTGVRGTFTAKCSVYMANDIAKINDTLSCGFTLRVKDVEMRAIEVPTNAFDSTGPITPRVRVRNNGTEIETFNVTLKIGTGYTATRSKTLGVGVEDTVTFPLWTPQRGSYPVKCSLFLSGDIIPANNVLSTSTLVGVNDIQVVAINYPVGTIDSGGAIYPKATVKNHSALAKTFNLIFKISNGYTNTRAITLNPGAQDTVSFSLWTGIRGLYTTRCSSALIGDIFSVNDTLSGSFTLQVRDVGVVAIVAPADTIERGDLSPKATIRNYGSVPESFYAYFKIYSSTGSLVYTDSIYINNLNSNNQTTRTFRSFRFYQGTYHVRCSTALANDMNPTNNVKFKDVYVRYTPPWVRRRDVPVGPSAKPVGGGGALVAGGGRIYLLKGNNTREFFVYNPDGDSWTLLESIPFIADSSKKKVNKGAALAYNNHANPDVIYATKGNNTLEFWMYNIQLDTWIRKAPVPIEYPVKKVKGGASLVYLKRGNVQYVYLLKGNNTNEFYGYRCDTDAWITDLKRPPLGPNLKAYKDGSCMVVGYNNYIYLLKGGAPTNEFYAYVPSGDSWITLETLPRYSRLLGRSSKVSDGASMCYDGDSLIYVIKGGNKQDFWCYNAIRRTWKELDTIPKDLSRKAPKSGSALVYLDKKIYLVKGNKTYEFWRYIPGISDVPVARVSLIPQLTDDKTSFSASHSKIKFINDYKNSKVRMQLNLDQKQRLRINIYNSLGQLVDNFFDSELSAGNYEFTISNDNFARGVYLIKCFIEDHEQSFKWVLR